MPNRPSSFEDAPALALHEVIVSVRRTPVLVDLHWEVPPGRFVALYGASATGKSTLLAAIAGRLPLERGRIQVLGADARSGATRKAVGLMPQTESPPGFRTVEEALAAAAARAGVRGARGELVSRTLGVLDLERERKYPLSRLSAALQRRVTIGCALVAQPPIVLLDEPYAFADAYFAQRLTAHLHELAGRGRTVVVATADPLAACRAPHLAYLRDGHIAVEAPLDALLPPGRATVKLTYREKTAPITHELHVQDYRLELPQALAGAVAKPASVELVTPSLDEVLAERWR